MYTALLAFERIKIGLFDLWFNGGHLRRLRDYNSFCVVKSGGTTCNEGIFVLDVMAQRDRKSYTLYGDFQAYIRAC